MRGTVKIGLRTVIVICVAASVSGCGLFSARSAPPAYRDRLTALGAEFAKNGRPIDPSIHYSPGVVRKTQPGDVVIDPKTGAKRVRDEYIVALKPGFADLELLGALRKLGINGELVGYVPTFNLVQLHAPDLEPSEMVSLRELPMVDWIWDNRAQQSQDAVFASNTRRSAAP
jgi:hypothetical protein